VRTERLAAAATVVVLALVLFIGGSLAADWLTPYRVLARPIARRIHFGDNDPTTTSTPRLSPHRAAISAGSHAANQAR
jgi:hypothetical protein